MSYNSSQNSDVVKKGIDGLLGPKGKRRGMKFRIRHSNKIKALGVTDERKRTVTVNRKFHKPGDRHRKTKSRKIPEVLRTRLHEFDHVQNPHHTERQAERQAIRLARRATKKQKKRIYSKQTIYRQTHDRK